MNYTKPALSFDQQADLLLHRGFQADRAKLIETLSRVSYYRLSAYWHPLKRADNTFVPGTTLEKVWRRYTFDRQLRLLVMDGIERLEIAVLRTQMVEQHTRRYGPFGYRNAKNFRPLIPDRKNAPEWHSPSAPDNRRAFAVLTLLQWLLRRIAPQSRWQNRLAELLKSYPDIPLNLAGFPAAWETSPIWAKAGVGK